MRWDIMKNMYDWENAFPKETEKFHTKLCNVLDALPKEAKTINRPKKRFVMIIAAAVMMLSSITAFAALKWNQRAIDNFVQMNRCKKNYQMKGTQNRMFNQYPIMELQLL
jgi:hypothetical protein